MGKKTWMGKMHLESTELESIDFGTEFLAVKHFVLQMLPPTVFC